MFQIDRPPGKLSVGSSRVLWAIFLSIFPISVASAHTTFELSGFANGFMHPLMGPDHLIVMVAVGLWGVFLGPPAIWVLPVVFPSIMAVGGVLGLFGGKIPYIEAGIAMSAIFTGVMVALAARPPLWVAFSMISVFALFHGYAHGVELPTAADPITYSIGFVIATGLLHLSGIALGTLARWQTGKLVVQGIGSVVALTGLSFLLAH